MRTVEQCGEPEHHGGHADGEERHEVQDRPGPALGAEHNHEMAMLMKVAKGVMTEIRRVFPTPRRTSGHGRSRKLSAFSWWKPSMGWKYGRKAVQISRRSGISSAPPKNSPTYPQATKRHRPSWSTRRARLFPVTTTYLRAWLDMRRYQTLSKRATPIIIEPKAAMTPY